MKRERTDVVNDPDLLITELEDGHLEIRKVVLDENRDLIYQRHVLHPGQNVDGEDKRVKAVAKLAHTAQRIAVWEAAQEILNGQ